MGASLTAALLLAGLVMAGAGLMVLKIFNKNQCAGRIHSCQEWWESD